jgi:2-polyprenyl-3-methyl-5-hydroxy-6-metoxy-1,4-benzoquinol methylase
MAIENRRDFDAEAASWDEKPERVKLATELTAAITAALPLSPRMKALDYGCGSGLVTLGLQPLVAHITGADSSVGMLDVLAKKALDQHLTNVVTRHIDLERRERLDGHFDLIVSSMTLHHIRDVAALVGDLTHMLKPGGWLALADLEAEDGSFHGDPTGVFHHGFERDYFRNLLTAQGLSDVAVVPAATISKPHPEGGNRSYPVLLAFGRK